MEACTLFMRRPAPYAALTAVCAGAGVLLNRLPPALPGILHSLAICLTFAALGVAGTLLARLADLGPRVEPPVRPKCFLNVLLAAGCLNAANLYEAANTVDLGWTAPISIFGPAAAILAAFGLYLVWGFTALPMLTLRGPALADTFRLYLRAEVDLNHVPILWLWLVTALLLLLDLSFATATGLPASILWPFLFNLSYAAYRDIWEHREQLSRAAMPAAAPGPAR